MIYGVLRDALAVGSLVTSASQVVVREVAAPARCGGVTLTNALNGPFNESVWCEDGVGPNCPITFLQGYLWGQPEAPHCREGNREASGRCRANAAGERQANEIPRNS